MFEKVRVRMQTGYSLQCTASCQTLKLWTDSFWQFWSSNFKQPLHRHYLNVTL